MCTCVCCCCCSVVKSHPTLLQPHGLQPTRFLCTWDFPARILERLPFPSPGDILHPGIKPAPPRLAGEFFTTKPPGKPPLFSCFSGELQLIHSHFPQNIWLLSLKLEQDESLIWSRVSRKDSQFPCRLVLPKETCAEQLEVWEAVTCSPPTTPMSARIPTI